MKTFNRSKKHQDVVNGSVRVDRGFGLSDGRDQSVKDTENTGTGRKRIGLLSLSFTLVCEDG